VAEYWRLDPTGGDLLDPPLQGETRRSGRWTPNKVTPEGRDGLRAHSHVLGLDLCWQPPKLRLWDTTAHAWLPDNHDIDTARQTAETRATAAETRAANETAAREAAEARAANEAAARKTAETRTTAAETRAANEAAARKTAEARAANEAAAREAAEAEIAELRARLRDTLGKSGQ
jgi:flagellar biosynthesis GTPase FlhF